MKLKKMSAEIPEVQFLLSEIEAKFGRRILTTTHFEALSVDIERITGDIVSASTLKRIWGYVNDKRVPRVATLDIMTKYIGKKSYSTFCEELKHSERFNSSFFSEKTIVSSDLKPGDSVTIGWNPNRIATLEYEGEYKFIVTSSENTKLEVGDRFEASNFIQGYPLYIARILRKNEYTPSFVAGSDNGLTLLKLN